MYFYDPKKYATKLKEYVCNLLSNEENLQPVANPDWSLLGKPVMKFFQTTPAPWYQNLLGTLESTPEKPVVNAAKAVEVRKKDTAPVRQQDTSKNNKVNDYDKEKLQKLLTSFAVPRSQLIFFALVLHPTNFGKTVENVLCVAFLVRDDIVKFVLDNDGFPFVRICDDEDKAAATGSQVQNLLSLSMRQWTVNINQ
ncbi:non-structural maintenance of chromosomes element 4 homolog A-like [Copidosoma floridanum]|uniref:non-structural maintenance of chromosomes element 4 homolog A-like n=1 Tax=Copidosoma floridanum TaxID=29053 RepID=UPI0006C95600|nr:non-structural maintenance of chromosomes element 4 homolog A-like [Copidosoma floridanum]